MGWQPVGSWGLAGQAQECQSYGMDELSKMTIRVPEELHVEARLAAVRARLSLERWVREAIEAKLKREQRKIR